MKKTYYEQLKDPRWQKMRLRIMERAGFMCEACGENEEPLNIHHGYYEKGLMPWEYDEKTLHCLCEGCHEEAGNLTRDLHLEIARMDICYFKMFRRLMKCIQIQNQKFENEIGKSIEEIMEMPKCDCSEVYEKAPF